MHVYNYRIFDRYDREVISLAVLADDDPDWRPSQYGYGRWGFRTGTEFPTVKLLDLAPRWQLQETDTNPFALLVLAHLKTLETRHDPANRHAWKLRLVKGLYERGMSAEDVRQLFRFVDWLMNLPPVLQKLFRDEMDRYEEEKHMPFMTSIERLGRTEELVAALEAMLNMKFGAEGLRLLPEIQQIDDLEKLRAIRDAINSATTVEELQRVWKP
jgi:hypothetical protein